jgi:hypothetical protein
MIFETVFYFSAQSLGGSSSGDAALNASGAVDDIESRLSERLSQLYISMLGAMVRVQVRTAVIMGFGNTNFYEYSSQYLRTLYAGSSAGKRGWVVGCE